MFSKKWVKAAGIRAIKTFAQTLAGYLSVGMALFEIDWHFAFSVSAVSAILSLLMSVAGLPEVDGTDSKKWIKAAGIRALKTFAQTLAGYLSVGMALFEIDWHFAFSVSAVSAILSLLMSLTGLPEVDGIDYVDIDKHDD